MKLQITYERLMPDTVRGEAIIVKQIYSDFDQAKIDALEKQLQETIGTAIITEYEDSDDKI